MNSKRIILFFLIGFCLQLRGQELPPIKSYTSEQYKAGNQNWGITQNKDLELFFANNTGLVVFNGNDWNLYPSPNQTIMRSVHAVDNRVYSGSYMDFGYWESNSNGAYSYTSLSAPIQDELIEDENFWKIHQVEGYLLFQSLNRIYIYNTKDGTIDFIDTLGILKMFKVDNTIYYQDIDRQVFQIQNGKAVLFPPLINFNQDRIINIFKAKSGLVLLTEKRGFFNITATGLNPWVTDLDAILAGQSIYSGIQLLSGSYAVGTIANGLILLDANGRLLFKVDQSNGLANNTVLSLKEDAAGNLWAGLDNGIDVINLKAPVNLFTDLYGTIGSVYSSIQYKNRLYLGTNQGLFARDIASDKPFEFIEGTSGQVWNLSIIDNTLFVGHNDGTLIVDQTQVRRISSVPGTWNFITIPNRDNYILQGTYTGLSYLVKNNGLWEFGGTFSGFDISARFLVAESETSLWVNHEYKGVYNLMVNLDRSEVTHVVRDSTLTRSRNSGLTKYLEHIIYASESGVFKKEKGAATFVKDTLLSRAIGAPATYLSGQLIIDKDDNLWLFGASDFTLVKPSSFGDDLEISKIALSEELRNLVIGFENVRLLEDGTHLFGTTQGYMNLNLNEYVPHTNVVAIYKIKAQDNKGNVRPINKNEPDLALRTRQNSLSFTVNTSNYDNYLAKYFRYKLEGAQTKGWSSWTTSNTAEFPGLSYGDYTFMVQSKIGIQISENTATYSFSIKRPWYLTNWAIVLYFAGFVLLVFLVNSLYKWYYNRQQEVILLENKNQLELQRSEAEREIISLKNSSLEQDVLNKNQELAISTMGIIRKNEVLSHIQKEMSHLKDSEYSTVYNRINKIINGSINDSDDWQRFEEAFNNADKDFIDKTKAKYESLTPNDLKLCAYLRLNLSSKEIAPLLNISTRSVEIRRYRLRKKMNLASGVNLVEHIMAI